MSVATGELGGPLGPCGRRRHRAAGRRGDRPGRGARGGSSPASACRCRWRSFFQSGPQAAELLVDDRAPGRAGARRRRRRRRRLRRRRDARRVRHRPAEQGDRHRDVALGRRRRRAQPRPTATRVVVARRGRRLARAGGHGGRRRARRPGPQRARQAGRRRARRGSARRCSCSSAATRRRSAATPSCSPRAGYRHERSELVDTFPHTTHVEVVTRFVADLTAVARPADRGRFDGHVGRRSLERPIISPSRDALAAGRPVVALESTIFSHLGLPSPANAEALERCLGGGRRAAAPCRPSPPCSTASPGSGSSRRSTSGSSARPQGGRARPGRRRGPALGVRRDDGVGVAWRSPPPPGSPCSPPAASAASTAGRAHRRRLGRPRRDRPPPGRHGVRRRQGVPRPAAHAGVPRDRRRAGARLAARLVPRVLHPLVRACRCRTGSSRRPRWPRSSPTAAGDGAGMLLSRADPVGDELDRTPLERASPAPSADAADEQRRGAAVTAVRARVVGSTSVPTLGTRRSRAHRGRAAGRPR